MSISNSNEIVMKPAADDRKQQDEANLMPQANGFWKRLTGFDLFVAAGGIVNLIVIGYLLGYWLLYG